MLQKCYLQRSINFIFTQNITLYKRLFLIFKER